MTRFKVVLPIIFMCGSLLGQIVRYSGPTREDELRKEMSEAFGKFLASNPDLEKTLMTGSPAALKGQIENSRALALKYEKIREDYFAELLNSITKRKAALADARQIDPATLNNQLTAVRERKKLADTDLLRTNGQVSDIQRQLASSSTQRQRELLENQLAEAKAVASLISDISRLSGEEAADLTELQLKFQLGAAARNELLSQVKKEEDSYKASKQRAVTSGRLYKDYFDSLEKVVDGRSKPTPDPKKGK